MKINNTIKLATIFYTVSTVSVEAVLKCLSGHSQYATQCTSQSYCVSITSKNGPVQRSCDGNSISQISLCSMYAMHGIPRTIQTDYSSFPISLGGPSSQAVPVPKSSSSRSSRRAPMQMCFNAGDLGDVCCCNTDYCNSSRLKNYMIIIVFPIFYRLWN